jgi:hypothetical protein
MRSRWNGARLVLVAAGVALLAAARLEAQLSIPELRGIYELKYPAQPPPGWYAPLAFYYYNADQVRTKEGVKVPIGTLDGFALAGGVTWVSSCQALGGAHFSATILPAGADFAIENPLEVKDTSWGLADLYVQPLQLGWHFAWADVVVGYGFFAPTGRFEDGAPGNTGLGMWSHEFSTGATVYFDKAKHWNLSTTALYNIQSHIKGTDKKAGDVFSLSGGLGYSFLQGYANIGAAYYFQWKVTDDQGTSPPAPFDAHHKYIGIGPQLDIPVPIGGLPLLASIRYFFETGNRVATQGNALLFMLTYAMPNKP